MVVILVDSKNPGSSSFILYNFPTSLLILKILLIDWLRRQWKWMNIQICNSRLYQTEFSSKDKKVMFIISDFDKIEVILDFSSRQLICGYNILLIYSIHLAGLSLSFQLKVMLKTLFQSNYIPVLNSNGNDHLLFLKFLNRDLCQFWPEKTEINHD